MAAKYLFLDVDGTLFSTKTADIPASARAALHQARMKGSKVFLCTGRSLAECGLYLGYEDVDGFVFAAGAMVYAEHHRIYDRPLAKEDLKKLTELVDRHDLGWSLEGAAGSYSNEKGYEMMLRYFSGGMKPRQEMVHRGMENGCYPIYYMDESEKIYKMCVYSTNGIEIFETIRKELTAPYILTVTFRNPKFHDASEITDGRITKATGIEKILAYYGTDRAEAAGFGDSENDIPMFRACGIGVAMGNAFESVKQAADYVTTDIDDDGIWNAFRHLGVI